MFEKIKLPNVTLLTVDTENNLTETKFAVKCCTKFIEFNSVKILTKKELPKLNNYRKYNLFMLYELHKWFDTDYVLTIQQDGHIINPLAWSDKFLNYDYIGAPWIEDVVGNGGFSLRSKRFCKLVSSIPRKQYLFFQEDANICKHSRFFLTDHGMKFAPVEVGSQFSYEKNDKFNVYKGSFGFHGRHSLLRKHKKYVDCKDCKNNKCSHFECAACDLQQLTVFGY